MRTKPARVAALAAFLFAVVGPPSVNAQTSPWRSGRVISAVVSGHGPAEIGIKKKKVVAPTDIWWTYCISSEGRFYSVISRADPKKTGLTNNRRIRFTERQNKIYVAGPRGQNIALRIQRKDKSGKCP